jgi:hypothetical protein
MTPLSEPTSSELRVLTALAAELAQRGYSTNLHAPPPYLEIHHPQTGIRQQVYTVGRQFYAHPALHVGTCSDVTDAADTITWALKALRQDPP